MNLLARKLAHILAENARDSLHYEDEIRYGLEIFVGGLGQTIIIMGVALLLGLGKEVLAIMIPAAVFRRYSDGPHCQAYYRCTIASLVDFILLGYISRFIPYNHLLLYILSVTILTLLIIYYYVPAHNPLNPVTDATMKRVCKQKSFTVLILVIGAATIAGYSMGEKSVATALLLGLFWQNLALLPWGPACVRLWDRFFDKVEKIWKGKEVPKC